MGSSRMSRKQEFADFIRRIRAGDETAAVELVRRYEPLIRREMRLRLDTSDLHRTLDSVDISQSVFASFFARMADGQYDLNEPAQLAKLLVVMAKNKLVSQTRRQLARKRDARRLITETQAANIITDTGESPSQVVSGREMLDRYRNLLTEEEYRISEFRQLNLPWDEIARRLGGTADGRRMQLTRAMDRISKELGIP